MRLIDADALKDMMIQAYNDALPDFSVPWQRELARNVTISLMADIDETPTVDAVPVVRCKDCKHLSVRSGALGVYQCAILGDYPSGEYFCSYGERKGGDE